MKRLVVMAFLLVGLLAPTGASAHDQSRWDGNDAGGPLDFQYTYFGDGHGEDNWSQARRVWLCVEMGRPWSTWRLRGAKNYIWFELDTRNNSVADYYVNFIYRQGELKGRMLNKRFEYKATTHGYRFSKRKGACVYFKAQTIKPIEQVIRWRVYSGYQSQRVCRRFCWDDSSVTRHRWSKR